MLEGISYYFISPLPVIAWLGLITFISLASTLTIGYLMHKGILDFNKVFKYHKLLAFTTFLLALIHLVLGISLYIK